MSTDYDARCYTCRRRVHFGQRMGLGFSTGHGSKDTEGHAAVMKWLEKHLGDGHDVRLEFCEAPNWAAFEDDHDEVYRD